MLGAGGMGVVVAATHVGDGRRVAIKTILPRYLNDRELRSRFARESKAVQKLTSEHAVRVLEVCSSPDGVPYLVMELLEGTPLDQLARKGPMPIAQAVGYVIEACDALAEAHRRGIVHRDIKPSNLFVTEREGQPSRVKVLDFGISKITPLDPSEGELTSVTVTGSTLGSPMYMSPEQLRNPKQVDARTDIWALGLVLHRLIAGKSAFEADSIGQHLLMIGSEPPTPLRKHRVDVSEALERVVLRCIQRHLPRRFRSVGQLVTALAPFAPAEAQEIVRGIGEPVEELAVAEDAATMREPKNEKEATAAWAPEVSLSDRTTAAVSREGQLRPLRRRSTYIGAGAAVLLGGFVAVMSQRQNPDPAAPDPAATARVPPAPSPVQTAVSSAPIVTAGSLVEPVPSVSATVTAQPSSSVSSRARAPAVKSADPRPKATTVPAAAAAPAEPAATGQPMKLKGPVETKF
jgi:serine/threonine protein kinase